MAQYKSATKFHRHVREMARELAQAHGGDAYLVKGGCHAKLVLEVGGHSRNLAVATSPRKEETALWGLEKEVRRVLKEMRS